MLKKKCILLTVIICMLTSFIPFYTVSAAEYYDMKYFRFLASQSDDDNLPGNVKEKDKKWTTKEPQKQGDYFLIDMYQELEVGKIVLEHEQSEYPGKYSVYVSTKMEYFGEPIISEKSGNESTQTTIDFPSIEKIRFIKIVLEAGTETNSNAWSINSLKVFHANNASSKVQYKKAEKMQMPSKSDIHAEFEKSIGIDVDSFDGTRASFAALLVALTKQTVNSSVKGTCFADVNQSTNKAIEIEAISHYVEEGKFYPDAKIIIDDALEWIINALGYEAIANYAKEDKKRYRDIADQLELLENVNLSYGQELSKEAAVELLYNALMTPLASYDTDDNTTQYDLAAYKWHNIVEISGNVVSNGYTSRSGAALVPADHVMIGDNTCSDAEGLTDDYIGLDVIAYINIDNRALGDFKVVYVAPKPNRNDVTIIPGKNIVSGDLSSIKYYEDLENSRSKKMRFDQHPDMIYNGKGCTPFKEDKLAGIKNGYVTAIDSDNNGRIDLVIVDEYVDYFVSYIDRSKMIISDMYSNPNICLSESDIEKISIYRGSDKISFSDIKSKSILSVAADVTTIDSNGIVRIDAEKSSIYKIQVSEQVLSGVLNRSSDEIYSIDGMDFERSCYFDNAIYLKNATLPMIGKNYTFYLNYLGKIAATESISNANINYGLLVKVSTDDIEEDVEVKLINTAGKLQSFVCAEKIKVDGVRTKIDFNVAKSLFYDNVETEVFDQNTSEVVTVSKYQLIPQVIGYTLNEEGNITGIDTKKYNEKNEEKYSTLTYQAPEQYTCNVYRGMIYPTGMKSTSPNMNYDGAVLFVGPANIDDADIATDYQVYGKSYFQQDGKYSLEVFKRSEFNNLEIGFLRDGEASTSTADNYIVVDRTMITLNEDDEAVTRVEGVQNGTKFSADLYSDDVLKAAGLFENGKCTLKCGDLITVDTNQRGQIVTISRLFDVNNKDIALSNNGKYYSERRTTIGKVYKSSGDQIMVTSSKAVTDDAAEDSLELFNLPSTAIVYDEENREIRKATKDDIRAYKSVHSESMTSLVFILTTWGQNVSFIIYNFVE